MLLRRYGAGVWPLVWPPSLEQSVLLLIAGAVLPAALIGLRFPLPAGIFQFACAFIGLQMAHEEVRPNLYQVAHFSMLLAAAILAVKVLRGITEVTEEAFAEGREDSEKELPSV